MTQRNSQLTLIARSNRLLSNVGEDELELLSQKWRRETLTLGQTIEAPHQPAGTVYFVLSGLISIVAVNLRGRQTEVGIVGREGVSGTAIALGDNRSPFEMLVQISGTAMAMPMDDFRYALHESPALMDLVLKYSRTLWMQAAYTALANSSGTVTSRLARWLLMVQDRVDGPISLSHELLSLMIGTRRAGVTDALHVLEGDRLIRAERMKILILDRQGLELAAEGSYGQPEAEYSRLIAPLHIA